MASKNGSASNTSVHETLDFSQFAPAQLSDYGAGDWFYPKSNETFAMDHPFRRLLKASERDVMDTLTFLVYAKKSWKLQLAATYVSRACGGNPAPRTVEAYFSKFRQYGFLEMVHFNKADGNTYLVNPILMRREQAAKYAFFEFVEPLVDRVRALEIAARLPQVRGKGGRKKSAKSQMSVEENLRFAKEQSARDLEERAARDASN